MRGKIGGTLTLSASLILSSCFVLAVILFANQFATDNNAAISVSGDTNINNNINNLNASLITYYDSNNISVSGLYGSSIAPGSDTLSRVSTFKSGSEDSLPSITNSTATAIFSIFGNNRNILIMAGAFAGFLALAIGLYAWKTLKGGAPD